jgi:predicted metal-dependent enzyme (double-stranded beta helix superfamily)
MRSDVTQLNRRKLIVGAAGLLTASRASAQKTATPTVRDDAPRGARTIQPQLDRLLEDLKLANADGGQPAIADELGRTVASPARVLNLLGEPGEAGIHTLYRSSELTILNVVWAPFMLLLPHNHNMWASIGIYTGREDNIVWERRDTGHVAATGAASLSARQVFNLPAEAIHSVTNPIGRLTGAIHIYGGDFFAPGRSEWDSETLAEQPFDLAAAREDFAKAAARFAAVPD